MATHSRRSPVSLLLLILLATGIARAQQPTDWTSLDGPYGGEALPIVQQGSALYTSAEFYGLFRSLDMGRTWQPVLPGGTIGGVIDDSVLVVFNDDEDGRIFGVVPRQDTFEITTIFPGIGESVSWVEVGPDNQMFVLTRSALYRLLPGESAFSRLDLDVEEDTEIASISFGRTDTVMVVVGGKLYLSDDLGDTFVDRTDNVGSELFLISGAFDRENRIVVGTTEGLVRSADGGVTFEWLTDVPTPFFLGDIAQFSDGDYVIGLVDGSVVRVAADGSSVVRLGDGPFRPVDVVVLENDALLVADFGVGLLRSEDEGASFESVGLSGYLGEIHEGPEGDLLVGATNGYARSSDHGGSFEYRRTYLSSAGEPVAIAEVRSLSDGTIIGFAEDATIVRFEPEGAVEVIGGALPEFTPIGLVEGPDNTIVVVGIGYPPHFSTDGGRSWTESTGVESMHAITVGRDGTVWGVYNDLYRSDDAAKTFSVVSTPLDFQIDNVLPLATGTLLVSGWVDGERALYRSQDNGATFEDVDPPCSGTYGIDFSSLGSVLVAIGECGIVRWDETSSAWLESDISLPEELLEDWFVRLHRDDTYLYVYGRSGFFRTPDPFAQLSVDRGPVTWERMDLQ